MIELIIFAAALILTYFGIALFLRWSLKKGVLDVPNERSSHISPTPRGGGVVIVAVVLGFYICVSFFYPSAFSWGYVCGAVIIALISWFDDRYTVSFIWRFITHALAAILLIIDKGFWNEIHVPGFSSALSLGVFGAIITFLWIVWLINAYNFMDGIDGIAGVQAAIAGLAWLIVGAFSGNSGIYLFGGIILCSSVGFLIHNWHPARIFMGDVGSAFLGYTFAAIPLLARPDSGKVVDLLPVAAILFVWFFLFDSIVTITRRALRREKVWVAHREHLYQRLVATGLSHSNVSLLYGSLALIVSLSVVFGIAFKNSVEAAILPVVLFVTVALVVYCARRRVLN